MLRLSAFHALNSISAVAQPQTPLGSINSSRIMGPTSKGRGYGEEDRKAERRGK